MKSAGVFTFSSVLVLFGLSGSFVRASSVDNAECEDVISITSEKRKQLVRDFLCESYRIEPCALKVSSVTRCDDKVGYIIVWARPGQHPVNSWLVEWTTSGLYLYPTE